MRYFLPLVLLVVMYGCSGPSEPTPVETPDTPVETPVEDTFEPLTGFEDLPINLEDVEDNLTPDSAGTYTISYRNSIISLIDTPVDINLLEKKEYPIEGVAYKKELYKQLEPKDGYTRWQYANHLAEIVIHESRMEEIDSLIVEDSIVVDTASMVLLGKSTFMELKVYDWNDPMITPPDSLNHQQLTLQNGISIGTSFNDVVNIMGSGFLKKSDRIIYHDWGNGVAIFDFEEEKVIRMIIGRYNIDITEEGLPEFLTVYK